MRISGTMPALITPFRNGEVDEEALRALVERVIVGGCEGLVPCGTTGESVTLDEREHERVVRIVVEEAKRRVPVYAGAGTVSTKHTIELAELCKKAGADGLLLVCPYYNRPTQAGLEAHFRHVLAEVPMPSILYNIPGRTGVDLALETLEKLADVKEIVAIKEATGNVMRSAQIVAKCGDRFSVLSGDDALTLPMMAVGAMGVISVTSNVRPRETSRVTSLFLEGNLAEARKQHLALLELHGLMFVEPNPAPAKAALAAAGVMEKTVRGPLAPCSAELEAKVVAAISRLS